MDQSSVFKSNSVGPSTSSGIKKFIVIFFFFAAIIIIAATMMYLNNNQGLPNINITGSSQSGTLTFWGVNEPVSVMQPIINQYEQSHSSVKITYIQQPSNQYENLVVGRLTTNSGNKPDIVIIGNTWLPEIINSLSTAPSSDYTISDYTNTFYPTATQDFTSGSSIFAVPTEYDGLGVYYNKSMLAQAGYSSPSSDIFDFINQAKKLTVSNSATNSGLPAITQAGLAIGTTGNISNSADILSLLMLQNGTQMTDSTGKTPSFDSAQGQQALTFYTEMYSKYHMWDTTFPDSVTAFANQKVAMIYAPIWEVPNIKQMNPTLNFDIAPAPQLNASINLSEYLGYAVPNSSPYSAAAWDFIKYLETPSVLEQIYNNTQAVYGIGYPYPRKDMSSQLANSQYEAAYVKMAPTATSWYEKNDTQAASILNSAIDDVNNNSAAPSDALAQAASKMLQVLGGN